MKKITSLVLSFIMIISVLFALPVTGLAAESKAKMSGNFLYSVNSKNEVIIECCINDDARKIVVPSKIDGKKVTEIATRAFYENRTVEEIYISDGIKTIKPIAFCKCVNMKSLYVPDSVTYLGDEAFRHCKSLTDLYLSKNLKYMGTGVFADTPEDLTYDDGKGGLYFANYLLSVSDKVSEYIVKDGTTLIAERAGNNGYKRLIEKLYLPDSIRYISNSAFLDCGYLNTVVFNDGLKEIGDNAFRECPRLKCVTIPKSVTKLGKNALGYSSDHFGKPVHLKSFAINGYTNTAAQTYAKNNKFKFSTNALEVPTVKITAGKKLIKVKYTKVGSATGFEVKYTKGKKTATKTFKTEKSATKAIKNLSKGKYKVQVRTYHISGKKKAYSPWTAAKSINVK